MMTRLSNLHAKNADGRTAFQLYIVDNYYYMYIPVFGQSKHWPDEANDI